MICRHIYEMPAQKNPNIMHNLKHLYSHLDIPKNVLGTVCWCSTLEVLTFIGDSRVYNILIVLCMIIGPNDILPLEHAHLRNNYLPVKTTVLPGRKFFVAKCNISSVATLYHTVLAQGTGWCMYTI